MCDLTNTDWEVFIRMHTVCINHHMMWAVHWTKNERLTLYVHGREHVFLVVIPVTGCLVQIHRTNCLLYTSIHIGICLHYELCAEVLHLRCKLWNQGFHI